MIDVTCSPTPLSVAFGVLGAVNIVAIVVSYGCIVHHTSHMGRSSRFPVLFVLTSILGYAFQIGELTGYLFCHDLTQYHVLWSFYVIGRPMTFLPLMVLDMRIFILYYGCLSISKLRWQYPPIRNLKLGQRWLIKTLVKLLIPFLISFIFLVFYGDIVDRYFIVPLQAVYLLVFLFMIIMLGRKRTSLKKHHLETTKMSLTFWFVVSLGVIYSNVSWYIFDNVFAQDNLNLKYVEYFVNILIYDVQGIIMLGTWYWHYKKVQVNGLGTLTLRNTVSLRNVDLADIGTEDCDVSVSISSSSLPAFPKTLAVPCNGKDYVDARTKSMDELRSSSSIGSCCQTASISVDSLNERISGSSLQIHCHTVNHLSLQRHRTGNFKLCGNSVQRCMSL
eukprot:CFRG0794T1